MLKNGNQLVFDIGAHNGDDSAYYLQLGYRVIAVEANPLLAAACAKRFEVEIQSDKIKVLNVGVLKEPGEFSFYRNLTDDGWSSFEGERGKRGGRWEEISIHCTTVASLIENYGCPFFMKIDIEGADMGAISSLKCDIAPKYLSLELNCTDPIIETLAGLGYSSFKFVNGETFRRSGPIWDHEIGWRLLRKIGRIMPPIRSALTRLPERLRVKTEFDIPGQYNPDNYPFTRYSSGPFGEQAAGNWLSIDAAIGWFQNIKNGYLKADRAEQLWWDVHARHKNARPVMPTAPQP